MKRNILFITTDQQRFDSIGCNGNEVVNTPNIDYLAAHGINYTRAYNQNTVCMPARSSMLTGQYPRTHGVIANGIPLPLDAPSVAKYLSERAGYATALIGKAHFEPGMDIKGIYQESIRSRRMDTGSFRGFDYSIQAMHAAAWNDYPISHYGRWLRENHPEHMHSFADLLGAKPGGDTGAPETKNNPIPTEWYHTDWVADMTVNWLDSLKSDRNWFCWMSFPDPHHPWDPPKNELNRINWKDLDLPPGHPGSDENIRKVLGAKPAHWLAWYEGKWFNQEGGPGGFSPGALTRDQILEINAKVHVMNELIDEACGKVIKKIKELGQFENTDIFFTTDHGELQGDYGFIFKGPFHVDSLMRLPFIWKPAPVAGITPAVVNNPVEQIDLVPTFCKIAEIEIPEWAQGLELPVENGIGRERALCEWDSQFPGFGMHLRTIFRDGWLLTKYLESTDGVPNGLEELWGDNVLNKCGIHYDGTEGEFYNVEQDPHQFENLWSDPEYASIKNDLIADLFDSLVDPRVTPLKVEAPA